ncbi:MAG: hypothetical protein HC886_22800 [Leptolyngbyaceae cyanobacterium SM1_1_3]|nr:hypothetical protein [Leptolyngbyaceae cyanobacterium SM1_1_3]NJN02771.1 hypothetical protein [Leptolyngbyaceae cyanobacterium RM1_1_2]NJO09319.1 hypothetical protein [Leptolyngbyaceae cyanobacterium SL_1_1]
MTEPPRQLTSEELQQWQRGIAEANRNNIFCHCKDCNYEWVASAEVPCQCGSKRVEYIACWQFPDG